MSLGQERRRVAIPYKMGTELYSEKMMGEQKSEEGERVSPDYTEEEL